MWVPKEPKSEPETREAFARAVARAYWLAKEVYPGGLKHTPRPACLTDEGVTEYGPPEKGDEDEGEDVLPRPAADVFLR